MKTSKRERGTHGGTISRKEETKGNVKKVYKEEHVKEIDAEGKRRRYEHSNFRDGHTNENHLEGKEVMNVGSRGGRRRDVSSSVNSGHVRKQNHERREDVKVARKAVSKRHGMDNYRRHPKKGDSPKGRRGRDMNPRFMEKPNRLGGHYENGKGHYRDGINGGGRYDEMRRSPFGEDLAERNKRTVFIGNIPFAVKGAKHLLDILGLDEAAVKEVRLRPPKFFRYESKSAKVKI